MLEIFACVIQKQHISCKKTAAKSVSNLQISAYENLMQYFQAPRPSAGTYGDNISSCLFIDVGIIQNQCRTTKESTAALLTPHPCPMDVNLWVCPQSDTPILQ